MPRFRLPVAPVLTATLLVGGCDPQQNEKNPPQPDTPARPLDAKDPEATVEPLPQESPTDNHLPRALKGVRMGMSIDAFKAVRDPEKMEAHAFHDSMIPDLNGREDFDDMLAKLDEAENNAKKVQRADWPGTTGLYYLNEKFDQGPIAVATYAFADGLLDRVIVYYDAPDIALSVASGLRGEPIKPEERWTVPKRGETPKLQAWVYKERYAIQTARGSDEHRDGVADGSLEASNSPALPERDAVESPTAFTLGPLRDGSFSPVAKLTFDAKHRGKLEIIEAGDDAQQLLAAWETIAEQDVVHYKGHQGRALARISAKRGEASYPHAAAQALSQKVGQFASPL